MDARQRTPRAAASEDRSARHRICKGPASPRCGQEAFRPCGCAVRAAAPRGPSVMPKAEFGNEHLLGFVEFVDRAFIGLRKLHGAADDGGKHGVEFERGIHRAQDFFQRLEFGDGTAEFGGACPATRGSFRADDGDHRLFGESLQQRDLAVGKPPAAAGRSGWRRRLAVAQQRHVPWLSVTHCERRGMTYSGSASRSSICTAVLSHDGATERCVGPAGRGN